MCFSSAARPNGRPGDCRAIGMSHQVSGGTPQASRRRRERGGTGSPSRMNSWAAAAPHSRAAYSRTVSRTAPGFDHIATERRRQNLPGSPPTARARQCRLPVLPGHGCPSPLSPGLLPTMIVVQAPTCMRSPSARAISSPFPKRSSLSLRLVPLVDPRSVTVRPAVLHPQNGVLRGNATVGRVDAEIDAGFDALFAIGATDQCVAVQSDSSLRKELGKVDSVRAAACDDALVVLPDRR